MDVHKCIFYITENTIQAFVVKENGYELPKKDGEDIYSVENINQETLEEYFTWFDKNRALTEDDAIDYCFLSTKKLSFMDDMLCDDSAVSFQNANQKKSAKSSWTKDEILDFIDKYLKHRNNFEIVVKPKQKFIYQSSNLYDESDLKKLYLFCIPEFKFVNEKRKNKKINAEQIEKVETSTTTNVPTDNAGRDMVENDMPQKNDVSEEVSITTKFFRDMLSAKRKQ